MARFSLEVREATSLFRNRPFRQLWAAQFSALTVAYGLALAGIALVEGQTRSGAQTGLMIVSSILPAFLASLVAGAVVDRWERVRVLRASHLARAVVALAFWGGTEWLPSGAALTAAYAANAAVAAFSQFAMSAEMALLPDLAGRARLMSANALLQLNMLVAEGVGIVFLGPLVVKLAGVPAMGLVGAPLCALALALVTSLPGDGTSAGRAGERWRGWAAFGSDLQAGWRTIARDPLLWLVTAQATLAAVLLLVLLSLVPGLVSRHLGLSVEDAPFLMLPGGLGFGLGATLIGRWERWLSRRDWIAAGLTGVGVATALMGALAGQGESVRLWPFQVLILGVGLALALVIIPARTVLQERPPADMRGRVIAAQLALGNAVAVVPLLMGGALADKMGIRPVLGLLGLLALGGGGVGWYQARP